MTVLILCFSTSWCGPCKNMAPSIENVKQHFGDKITFTKIDADEQHNLANIWGIRSVPTLILLKDEQEIDRRIGGMSAPEIIKFIEQAF